jgi:hypothetical protein
MHVDNNTIIVVRCCGADASLRVATTVKLDGLILLGNV